jgi:hypothetical protein
MVYPADVKHCLFPGIQGKSQEKIANMLVLPYFGGVGLVWIYGNRLAR